VGIELFDMVGEEKIMKFYCPICKVKVYSEPSNHFRYDHQISQDDLVNALFLGLAQLDERINNLCELLEIREK